MIDTLRLDGYFDSNFGDDMIMKLIVTMFPDVTFLIPDNVISPLRGEPNICTANISEWSKYPHLIVTGSGFMINTPAAFKTELRWFLTGHDPGDYVLGCNIEPLDSPLKKFLIVQKLNRFRLITCRDTASYEWLRKNTRKPEIVQLPDILFSLPDEWLPTPTEEGCLGIAPMNFPGQDISNCLRVMAEAADIWVELNHAPVLLMAFDTGKENDTEACRQIRNQMRHPSKAQIILHKTGSEILEAYSRCSKIIGARFHSIVLAMRMGLPIYPIKFRKKVHNLLVDTQYPVTGCEIDQIDAAGMFRFLIEDDTQFRVPTELFQKAKDHAKYLEETLKHDRS